MHNLRNKLIFLPTGSCGTHPGVSESLAIVIHELSKRKKSTVERSQNVFYKYLKVDGILLAYWQYLIFRPRGD